VSLFVELVSRYDVDYIQTCLIPYSSGRAPRGASHDAARLLGMALGGCFCEHCTEGANETGLDFERMKHELLPLADSVNDPGLEQAHEMSLLIGSNTSPTAILLENPSLFRWLAFRRDSLTRFFKEVHERIHAIKPDIDLRLNAYITSNQEFSGLDLWSLKPHLDSIRSSDYSEQSGDMGRLEHKVPTRLSKNLRCAVLFSRLFFHFNFRH